MWSECQWKINLLIKIQDRNSPKMSSKTECTHATLHLIGCPPLLIPQFPNKVPLVFAYWKQILFAFLAESAWQNKYFDVNCYRG